MKPTKPFADFWIDEDGQAQVRYYRTRREWIEGGTQAQMLAYRIDGGPWENSTGQRRLLSPATRLALAAAGIKVDD